MESFKKLSIQVGLNGLSFCVLDSVNNEIIDHGGHSYDAEQTPYLLSKDLKSLLEKHNLIGSSFEDILIIHRTNNSSLVPKALFSKDNLQDYLKFNATITSNDSVTYDDLGSLDLVNVYTPFSKINELISEVFSEFRELHNSTVLLKTFLKQNREPGPHCFVHLVNQEMEVLIMNDNRFLLYNQHTISTKEDFLYHILFSLEQLGISLDEVKLRLFGNSKEEERYLEIARAYVHDVEVIQPINPTVDFSKIPKGALDFAILNSF
ncbi:DUF3822 family protein [Croceivirga thetidis]|uniref:DUF3822 family protein n=1 Tax=Croceivirga thetidis TaxID=2721623 RepID=A0ABX1GQK9_9FLAO|nr:DUF3822 family protein [Croceivirga thetidis]NKI31938.1 DUF3822 family protein [Croceivirga thetidis]